MRKLLSIGEILIDFIPLQKGRSLKHVELFERSPGGAPANVAATVTKMGSTAHMIGMVGKDAFGEFLIDTLNEAGVRTETLLQTDRANTALAFVALSANGERDFSFYRNPSADLLLSEEDINEDWFLSGDILHFCSVGLVESPLKHAHKKAIQLAHDHDCLVSFDPNIRLPLWASSENCRETILEFLPKADIVKISHEELAFITGKNEEAEAISSLFRGRVKVILLTKGENGAALFTRDFQHYVGGFSVTVQDTTGAGDAFIGAFLHKLLANNVTPETLQEFSQRLATELLTFANACGALTTTGKGGMPSIPTVEQINNLISDEGADSSFEF